MTNDALGFPPEYSHFPFRFQAAVVWARTPDGNRPVPSLASNHDNDDVAVGRRTPPQNPLAVRVSTAAAFHATNFPKCRCLRPRSSVSPLCLYRVYAPSPLAVNLPIYLYENCPCQNSLPSAPHRRFSKAAGLPVRAPCYPLDQGLSPPCYSSRSLLSPHMKVSSEAIENKSFFSSGSAHWRASPAHFSLLAGNNREKCPRRLGYFGRPR